MVLSYTVSADSRSQLFSSCVFTANLINFERSLVYFGNISVNFHPNFTIMKGSYLPRSRPSRESCLRNRSRSLQFAVVWRGGQLAARNYAYTLSIYKQRLRLAIAMSCSPRHHSGTALEDIVISTGHHTLTALNCGEIYMIFIANLQLSVYFKNNISISIYSFKKTLADRNKPK